MTTEQYIFIAASSLSFVIGFFSGRFNRFTKEELSEAFQKGVAIGQVSQSLDLFFAKAEGVPRETEKDS